MVNKLLKLLVLPAAAFLALAERPADAGWPCGCSYHTQRTSYSTTVQSYAARARPIIAPRIVRCPALVGSTNVTVVANSSYAAPRVVGVDVEPEVRTDYDAMRASRSVIVEMPRLRFSFQQASRD